MALLSDSLKRCGVKIKVFIKGVPSVGSGVVYVTPNECSYNYVLTAKHIFQEDSLTPFEFESITYVEIDYSDKGKFRKLDSFKKNEVKNNLIVFDEDLAIVIIRKNQDVNFSQIFVSDNLEFEEKKYFSWAIFLANLDQLHMFTLEHNDHELRRLKLTGNLDYNYLAGLSGAGVFHENKRTLYGIICRYPNENFQNETIDCAQITFEEINVKLKSLNKVQLDTISSKYKKEIGSEVVDVNQAYINKVCLNLELARRYLKTDIADDWFHDPLRYVDLLNQEYVFKHFAEHFGQNNYCASEAEMFYVPKKRFTLRLAQIMPFKDRIVYMAVVGVLAEKLDQAMIRTVYSARFNKFSKDQLIVNGVEQWKKMKYELQECAMSREENGNYKYGCVIEVDLLNFYDNINKKLLYEKILRVCETENEKNAASLLNEILSKVSGKESGLPQNSDASSLLASFYLNQVDIFMNLNSKAYYRFMDDIRIFCKDKFEARRILQILEFELRRCHLSVNSQKTEIFSFSNDLDTALSVNEKYRNEYGNSFDLELNKVARLRKSENHVHRKEAFQICMKLLAETFDEEDLNGSEDSARRANYALNTISILTRGKIDFNYDYLGFLNILKNAVASMPDKPWITSQICRVLNSISTNFLDVEIVDMLKEIVLEEKFNIYSFQSYQIWLLLAKHKISITELKTYSVRQIEKNDNTNCATIAAMIIYMCSVEKGFRRVILRKFGEGFTQGYFQNRTALIAMRAFPAERIPMGRVEKSLIEAHELTFKYKDKDLVFIPGGEDEENDDSENIIEQLYSI